MKLISCIRRSLGFDDQELVIVPVAFAQMLFNTSGLFRVLVEGRGPQALDQLKAHIRSTIARRHYGEDDITIITQDAVLATFDKILTTLTLTVVGIAAISLVVAGILIMNVMLMAVVQRTAEIGVLRALGGSQRCILVLFLLEGTLLATLGGSGGLLGGAVIAWLIHALVPATPVLNQSQWSRTYNRHKSGPGYLHNGPTWDARTENQMLQRLPDTNKPL